MSKHLLKNWIPLLIASTIIMLTIYAAVQQNIRQGANETLVQGAEDVASVFSKGDPDSLAPLGTTHTDIAASLDPFIIVYSATSSVVSSSGYLNNQVPTIPVGVLAYAQLHGEDRLTWQPAPGVRIATVVKYYNATGTGYVLVGRNLREVERLESSEGNMVLVAWIILIIGTLVWSAGWYWWENKVK